MRMKNLLLASAAFAALATAGQAQADGMYISVFGGANFVQNESYHSSPFYSSDQHYQPDTGFVVGAAVGTKLDKWAKGLRVELEAAYRRNDVHGKWATNFFNSSGAIDANASTFSLMANVAYDIDVGMKVKPYVMGGAGWARTKYEGALMNSTGTGTTDSFSAERNGFAWQLGAGFNYEVSPGVDVGLGYRYFNAPNSTYFGGKLVNQEINHKNDSHEVMVNLTIDTN